MKKLGRFVRPGHRVFGRSSQPGSQRRGFAQGWEYFHVCVDDATRLAYAELFPDERGDTVAAFLERAVAWYGLLGITVARVMTDSGPGYRSSAHASTCRRLGLRHLRTRPYRPRTNGKAERFIQTTLHEWPTAACTARAKNARARSLPGSGTTTSADDTAASATTHPVLDSTS